MGILFTGVPVLFFLFVTICLLVRVMLILTNKRPSQTRRLLPVGSGRGFGSWYGGAWDIGEQTTQSIERGRAHERRKRRSVRTQADDVPSSTD